LERIKLTILKVLLLLIVGFVFHKIALKLGEKNK